MYHGKNKIRMCGRRSRCFMGQHPKAIIWTFCLINIPATYFNVGIAPRSIWGEEGRLLITCLGIIFQLLTNIFMFNTSCKDPGIIPAAFISEEARKRVPQKYTHIMFKEDRIKYLMLQGSAAHGAKGSNAALAYMKFCETCLIFRP